MKIIDAHNHPDWHGHNLPKALENMERFKYGGDCFDNRLQELLNSVELRPDVLQKIYAENALRLVPEPAR